MHSFLPNGILRGTFSIHMVNKHSATKKLRPRNKSGYLCQVDYPITIQDSFQEAKSSSLVLFFVAAILRSDADWTVEVMKTKQITKALFRLGARALIWAPCPGTGTSFRGNTREPCTYLNRFSSVPAVFTFSQAVEAPTPNLLPISR